MAGNSVATRRDGRIPNLTLEEAEIQFRNFAGKEGQYNKEGDRNFVIFLDPETASNMIAEGWNVKQLRPREEGEPPQDYVSVAIEYRKGRPPTVVIVTSRGKSTLPEEMVEVLDYADIASCDVILNPYQWSVNGKSGVKAYLHSLYVNIREDDLQRKYQNVPELTGGPSQLALETSDPNEYVVDAIEYND